MCWPEVIRDIAIIIAVAWVAVTFFRVMGGV